MRRGGLKGLRLYIRAVDADGADFVFQHRQVVVQLSRDALASLVRSRSRRRRYQRFLLSRSLEQDAFPQMGPFTSTTVQYWVPPRAFDDGFDRRMMPDVKSDLR